eukprot:g31673.t1
MQVQVLAAANPYRRVAELEEFKEISTVPQKLEKADAMEHEPRMAYHVYPLPLTMKEYVWNFGALKNGEEKRCIDKILGAIPGNVTFRHGCAEAIIASQRYIRETYGGERSAVSLRDVVRCKKLFLWFLEHLPGLEQQYLGDKKGGHGSGDNPIVLDLDSKEEDPPVQQSALVLALAHCYYYRLGRSREQYARRMQELLTLPFRHVFLRGQDLVVRSFTVPPDYCLNEAIKENLFMMYVCSMTKTPLVTVGCPGSSKTLGNVLIINEALRIIRDNFDEEATKGNVARWPDLYFVDFQCSKVSESSGICEAFKMALEYQNRQQQAARDTGGKAKRQLISVLHRELEHPEVAFIGLSNWLLDFAKMNRVVLHNLQPLTLTGLEDTALAIVSGRTATTGKNRLERIKGHICSLARIYGDIAKDSPLPGMHGNRDFFDAARLVSKTPPSLPIDGAVICKAFLRSFGGLPGLRGKCFQLALQHLQLDEETILSLLANDTPLRLAAGNLRESGLDRGRHLMFLSKVESWQLLLDAKVLCHQNCTILFGSEFSEDRTSAIKVYQDIDRVKNCIESGHRETQRSRAPGLQTSGLRELRGGPFGVLPPALLHRFERHLVARSELLSKALQRVCDELRAHLARLTVRPEQLIPGFNEETLPSLLLTLTANAELPEHSDAEPMEVENGDAQWLQRGLEQLLWVAAPEHMARLDWPQGELGLRPDRYFVHADLPALLAFLLGDHTQAPASSSDEHLNAQTTAKCGCGLPKEAKHSETEACIRKAVDELGLDIQNLSPVSGVQFLLLTTHSVMSPTFEGWTLQRKTMACTKATLQK